MTEVVYFGVKSPSKKGHFFYGPHFTGGQTDIRALRDENNRHIDGGFLESQGVKDVPGRAAYRQFNGYSIVSWWDRSGDSRPASNSAFIVRGNLTPQEVMQRGSEVFTTILPRQQAPIILPDGTVLAEQP